MALIKFSTPPTLAGLFFCLASAEGAGLFFCQETYEPHTSVYSVFCRVNAIIPPMPQNSAQGFTGTFPTICRVLTLLYIHIRLYCTACDTSKHITAPQRLQCIPDTSATPDAVQGRTAAYYNKVYKGAPLLWIHAQRYSIAQTMPAAAG